MTQFSDIHAVIEQLQIGRLFLSRPTIQAQFAAFFAAVALAWALSRMLWTFGDAHFEAWKRRRNERWQTFWRFVADLLHYLTFPAFAFASVEALIQVFQAQGWRSAFLAELTGVLWFFFVYRLFVALLYGLLGHDYMRRYQTRLLMPLFALFIARIALGYIINVRIVTHVVIFTPFEHPITLGSLLLSPFTLYMLFFTSRAIQDMLQDVIVPRTNSDPNIIHAILTLSRYVVIFVGVVIIAASLGVNMATVAFISGGLSVGIGFGMQQIVANFLSGLFLLFEQTLRPGDVIDLNGEIGVVEKLSIRSTTVRTPNNVKITLPNESLLTASVRTYTSRNRLVRIMILIGAGYNSQPENVRNVLLDVAEHHPAIRKDPKPQVLFQAFGESSLDFQLNVWIEDPLKGTATASELRYAIWDAFTAHHIEIPFPQRDLHIRSGSVCAERPTT